MRPRSPAADSRLRPSFFRTVPARKPRTECDCQPVARIIESMVAPAGPRSIAITRACLVSGRCWLLDAMAGDAAARGSFVCANVGLRAVGRTDLRCFDLAPAPLAAPECFN